MDNRTPKTDAFLKEAGFEDELFPDQKELADFARSLETRCGELEAALKPFADVAQWVERTPNWQICITQGSHIEPVILTLAQVQQAAAALKEKA